MLADLNYFFPKLINTGKCLCGFVFLWEVVVCFDPNKDQKHSDITSAQSDCPLALQSLLMPQFNFEACNPIKERAGALRPSWSQELGEDSWR